MARKYKLTLSRCEYRPTLADLDFREFELNYTGNVPMWWAAYDRHGEVIAFCGLDMLRSQPVAFLCRAWVHPDYRGHGLQTRMIRLRERAARRLGAGRIITYTARHNCASANSLIRCGYKTYQPPEEWGTTCCTYWYKKLEGR